MRLADGIDARKNMQLPNTASPHDEECRFTVFVLTNLDASNILS